MDPFLAYLFKQHTQDEIRRWATLLAYFRFCRAFGGMANDGDRFLVAMSYTDQADYLELTSSLGIFRGEPASGNSVRLGRCKESQRQFPEFKSTVEDYANVWQIGHCQIAGTTCFAWAQDRRLTLSVHGTPNVYEVGEEDFHRALNIESVMGPLSARVLDPPLDHPNCVCPKYYSHFW